MKIFKKYIINLVSLLAISTLLVVGCSGGGKCAPATNPAQLSLSLSAPDQYPAGMTSTITAYLTMTNTSSVDANNLFYTIPDENNHTGVTITVENGANQTCLNIAAGKSCTFPVIIGAYAHPGSFRVTATPNISSSISSATLNNTLTLTVNIGLTDLPANDNSGANGISFLYAHRIVATEGSDTKITIVGVVNSAEAGAFNTINLTDSNGTLLNFEVLSGNSGNGLTNLTKGSIVTFLLTIPENSTSYSFYAQTMSNGTVVNQGDTRHPILLSDVNHGVLVVQPTAFNLSAMENYTSQIITYTNIGNGVITNLRISEPVAPITMQNNCSSTLSPGASCTVILSSGAAAGVSGSGSVTAEYGNSESTAGIAISQYSYSGINPIFGLDVVPDDDFNFITDTAQTTISKQITLTNTGNVSESNFVFTFEEAPNFTLSSGTSGTSCVVSNGNTVAKALAVNDSCTVTLTYTNGSIGSGNGSMIINYLYNGNLSAPIITKALSYETVQATANLGFNPHSPYTFDTIIANNMESVTTVFTITNHGSDEVSGLLVPTITGINAAQFVILPSTGAEDCQTKANLGVGATCTLNVRFGPTSIESTALTADLNITGSSQTGGTIDVKLVLNGATSRFYNIVMSDVQFQTPPPSGGNGYQESNPISYPVLNTEFGATLVITYKNMGNITVTNFTVESQNTPPYYTFFDVFSNCFNVTLESNGSNSCTMGYLLNRSTPGSKNVPFNDFNVSWVDGVDTISSNSIKWLREGVTYNTFYVNVYAPASVSAVLSSNPSGSNTITDVSTESKFYVVFQLSGGYQVPSGTYTATAPYGFSPPSGSCSLLSESAICAVEFTAPNTVSIGSEINLSGPITVSPLVLTLNVNSLSNQWTWMGGTYTRDSLGVYGTKGTPSTNNIPAGRSLGSSWTDSSGNFWLFGGNAYDINNQEGQLNDLWKYNPITQEWTWFTGVDVRRESGIYGTKGVSNSSNTPGAREGAITWVESGYLWLFGGSGCPSQCLIDGVSNRGHLNDLWKYNISTNEWTWISGADIRNSPGNYGTKGVVDSTNMPRSRYGGNSWQDLSGNLWLFGGRDFSTSGEYLNDLWKYNPNTDEWVWMSGSNTGNQTGSYGTKGVSNINNVPPGRQNATSWTDSIGDFWLFGGEGPLTGGSVLRLNDLWKYSPTTNEWTWVSGSNQPAQLGNYGTKGVAASTNVPGARRTAIGWTVAPGVLWLFGGSGYDAYGNATSLNDLWKYDVVTNEWTWVSGADIVRQPGVYGTLQVPSITNIPGARSSSIMWSDSSGALWLFGGSGYDRESNSGFLNDMWQYQP